MTYVSCIGARTDTRASGSNGRQETTMTASILIRQQIAAAKALGAPLFGLDHLLAAAEVAEKASSNFTTTSLKSMSFAAFAENEHDENLKVIETAARAAFGFACCVHGPAEFGDYRESEVANALIVAGLNVARQYV
jgi:hypothetical protein